MDLTTWHEIVKVANSLGEFPEQFIRVAISERLARTSLEIGRVLDP